MSKRCVTAASFGLGGVAVTQGAEVRNLVYMGLRSSCVYTNESLLAFTKRPKGIILILSCSPLKANLSL